MERSVLRPYEDGPLTQEPTCRIGMWGTRCIVGIEERSLATQTPLGMTQFVCADG